MVDLSAGTSTRRSFLAGVAVDTARVATVHAGVRVARAAPIEGEVRGRAAAAMPRETRQEKDMFGSGNKQVGIAVLGSYELIRVPLAVPPVRKPNEPKCGKAADNDGPAVEKKAFIAAFRLIVYFYQP